MKAIQRQCVLILKENIFFRFLYKNLLTFEPGSADSLFVRSPGNSDKLSIKDNATFHLYISTAPCGDGALFSVRYHV